MRIICLLLLLAVAPLLRAQAVTAPSDTAATAARKAEAALDSAARADGLYPDLEALTDSLPIFPFPDEPELFEPLKPDTTIFYTPLDRTIFLPAVYTGYKDIRNYDPFKSEISGDPAMRWVEEARARQTRKDVLLQNLFRNRPDLVHKHIATLPHAPKAYYGEVNPKNYTIKIKEVEPDLPTDFSTNVGKKHWLRSFNVSLQFSQAYISPNWYQGGNNNLNFLGNIYYNVKLNPAFHPNLLFENTFQYKLGINNAPEDSLRDYSISDDLLQINSTFGYKAAHRWYYSVTAQFKTQVLNSYVKNKHNLSSAFLSPADFNAGLGMTYSYANKRNTFSFDTSISPISYNMRICVKPDSVLRHEDYNINADRKYSMKFGSTAEAKINWQLRSNINFKSRVFVFSDYSYIQCDWENTLQMNVSKFLSTQIYWHLRYDSTTPRSDDPDWHKLQVKEILSFGITYAFSSI